jgi:outer membrane receptor protein involved in Fe transport
MGTLAPTASFSFLAYCLLAPPVSIRAQDIDPYQLTLEQLGQVQVFTASRSLTSVEKAPSIVTVITAEEIRHRGYKNLQDALQRVVGFSSFSDNFDIVLGQRGFIEDGNHAYLFLVDGHPINNQIDYALGHEPIMPKLSRVKQIEILHTPGSTLWGADAAGGIIHIFTFDGKDIDDAGRKSGSFLVSADYEFENRRNFVDFLYGKKFGENSDFLFSFNRAESNGDLLPAYHAGEEGLVEWSQGRPFDPRANAENKYGPTYDLYGKLRIGGFSFLAHHTTSPYISNWNTDIRDSARFEHFRYLSYGDARYSSPIGESLELEAAVFFDYFYDRTLKGGTDRNVEPALGYPGYGGSSILTYSKSGNRLKSGIQFDRRHFDALLFYQQPLEAEIENVYGIFAEDEYSGLENTILTLGVRYDYNDLRDPGGKFYPRAAAVYSFSDRWSMKYAYNSGYVRPLYGQIRGVDGLYGAVKDGAPWIGLKESQRSGSNDLQFNYNSGRTSAALTLFYMVIRDFSTYIGYTALGHPDTAFYGYEYIHQNVGDMSSRGVEFEGRHHLTDAWTFYGNTSFAQPTLSDSIVTLAGGIHTINIVTETDMDLINHDLEKVGFPQWMWNFGIDWNPLKNQFINVHYRGWTANPAKVKREPNTYTDYGPEHFIDMNYTGSNLGLDGLELGVYAKNLLDNEAEYPSPNDGGYIVNKGRTWGLGIKYKF